MDEYLTATEMAKRMGIPEGILRSMQRKGKVPFLKLGHRTIRFQPERVAEAIKRFEIPS